MYARDSLDTTRHRVELPSSRGGSKATMLAHHQGYWVDNCLYDNYLGLVMWFVQEICLRDMICVLVVVAGNSFSLNRLLGPKGRSVPE